MNCIFTIFEFNYQSASNGVEKLIGDTLRENPDNLFSNLGEAKKKLMDGKHALAYVRIFNLCIKLSRPMLGKNGIFFKYI